MSYALIDNASLTSVQRAMGKVTVKTPDTVNGDLVALENLVQAILFYDELVCIDNYKQEHKEARKKEFNFINFLSPGNFQLEQIEEKAKSEARSVKPEIRGGVFNDPDFSELLELLKLNIICTWDLRSSVYYLTMKMLGQPNTPEYEKYSELSSAIFNELSDVSTTLGHWSTEARLIGSDGTLHTKANMDAAAKARSRGFGGTTRSLDMFIASLNWLAFKSIYYSLAANYFKADSFLHPIRHAYQIHWMKKTGAFGHDFTSKLIHSLSNQLSTDIAEIIDTGRTMALSLEIPIFSAWLAAQSGDVKNVISAALEIKKEQTIQDVRGHLRDIRIAFDQEGLSEANKAVKKWEKNLKSAGKDLKGKYGLDAGQGIQGSFLIKVFNSIAALTGLPQFPEFNFKIPLPEFITTNSSNSFSNIFKDVTSELVSTERLGGYRDLLASAFVIDEEHYAPPKTESPEFRHVSSDWKIPM